MIVFIKHGPLSPLVILHTFEVIIVEYTNAVNASINVFWTALNDI